MKFNKKHHLSFKLRIIEEFIEIICNNNADWKTLTRFSLYRKFYINIFVIFTKKKTTRVSSSIKSFVLYLKVNYIDTSIFDKIRLVIFYFKQMISRSKISKIIHILLKKWNRVWIILEQSVNYFGAKYWLFWSFYGCSVFFKIRCAEYNLYIN
jgi:hypothetical protein